MKNIVPNLAISTLLVLLVFSSCRESDLEDDLSAKQTYSFTFNGKSYLLVKEARSWQDAVSYAVANGAYLAEINSEEEQIAIFTQLSTFADINFNETNNQFGFAAVWLGGNDIAAESVWVWNGNNDETDVQFWNGGVDGNTVNGSYNNWGNEPDNDGNQDVLCMGLEATPINAVGKWTDLDGSDNNLFFVMEYD
ncbi:MAG: hypothetical protein IPL46_01150 [Saprospiraceae bacterium]|nr:hypothetical protein [Saprospiraceae bacterium]